MATDRDGGGNDGRDGDDILIAVVFCTGDGEEGHSPAGALLFLFGRALFSAPWVEAANTHRQTPNAELLHAERVVAGKWHQVLVF